MISFVAASTVSAAAFPRIRGFASVENDVIPQALIFPSAKI